MILIHPRVSLHLARYALTRKPIQWSFVWRILFWTIRIPTNWDTKDEQIRLVKATFKRLWLRIRDNNG